MEEVKIVVYKTIDGKIFENKEEAEKHERNISNVYAFKIYYQPDLTEGRGFQKYGYLLINANKKHEIFARHWCYERFGNEITFVMGVYGSNAITKEWSICHCPLNKVEDDKILDKIEEQFVNKLWS